MVGNITCSYIVQQLKLQPIGYVDSVLLPQVMVVHNSKPLPPIQVFGGTSIVLFLSEVPLATRFSMEFSRAVAAWAKSVRADNVIGVSGLPSTRREEAPDGRPSVLAISADDKTLGSVTSIGVMPFEEGLVTGTHASLLKECMKIGQRCLLLLAESLIQFPDPVSASNAVEVLGKLLGVKIDLEPLLREAEEIRLRNRELMQQTQVAQQPVQQPASAYR